MKRYFKFVGNEEQKRSYSYPIDIERRYNDDSRLNTSGKTIAELHELYPLEWEEVDKYGRSVSTLIHDFQETQFINETAQKVFASFLIDKPYFKDLTSIAKNAYDCAEALNEERKKRLNNLNK